MRIPPPGTDGEKIRQLPNTKGLQCTVLADAASDTRWLTSARVVGGRVRLVGRAGTPMKAG